MRLIIGSAFYSFLLAHKYEKGESQRCLFEQGLLFQDDRMVIVVRNCQFCDTSDRFMSDTWGICVLSETDSRVNRIGS